MTGHICNEEFLYLALVLGSTGCHQSLDPGPSKRLLNAVATSSVKSLACRLLPFFAKASLEHS